MADDGPRGLERRTEKRMGKEIIVIYQAKPWPTLEQLISAQQRIQVIYPLQPFSQQPVASSSQLYVDAPRFYVSSVLAFVQN